IAVLAARARLRQREQHALRVDEAAHAVEILLHPFGVDEQFVDHAGQPSEREIERDRRVGADEAFDRRIDRKSTSLNSSHYCASRMPSSACKKISTSITN